MDDTTHEIGDYGPEFEEIIQVNENQGASGKSKQIEPDLLPEYCRYRDEGCEYAKSCLTCPFPQCLFDAPRGRQRWLKGKRDQEIIRLFSEGWDVQELAMLFGVSKRTIQRAMNENS